MNRGSILVLTKDDEGNINVYKSIEFNGGMNIENHGKEVINMLNNIEDISSFDSAIKDFNNKYFQYKNENITYQANSKVQENNYNKFFNPFKSVFNFFKNNKQGLIDLSDNNYIKNLSDEDITITCRNGNYILKPHQILVTEFAECINNRKNSIQLDTLSQKEELEEELEL